MSSDDKYKFVREHLQEDFENISTKELQAVLRHLSNIKNMITKDLENINPMLLRNKCIPLKNVFVDEFIVTKLRKEVKQEYHERLNSLLAIMKMIPFSKNVPYSVDFFRFLMK